MNKLIFFLAVLISSLPLRAELNDEQKSEIVENIYKRIYSAIGTPEEAPDFKFDTRKSNQIAYMMKNRDGFPMIGFESKAFDVCASFGERRDDAIALLLGHEISHHHLKHHWGQEFRSAYSISALEADIKALDKADAKKFEAQADERGGIFCYLAGYNTSGLAEVLLRKLYAAYEIKDSPKYPSLEERILIAKERDSLVSTYIKVFEAGNYAMLIAEYELAIDCYRYIIGKKFHSKEIYNNLGVAFFLQGVAMTDPDDIKYLYPVEIDLSNKLNNGGSKGMGPDEREYFENALKRFKSAMQFDDTYATAHLNVACTYSVLGNFKKAMFYAEESIEYGRKYKSNSTLLSAMMLTAIIHDQNPDGDKEQMIKTLDKLSEKGHLMSKLNKQIIQGADIATLETQGVPLSWMTGASYFSSDETLPNAKGIRTREKINGLNSYSISELGAAKMDETEIKFSRDNYLLVGIMDDSKIYVMDVSNGDHFAFHSTLANYKGRTSLGLSIGSDQVEILKAYGMPNVVMSSDQGYLYCYNRSQLVMIVGNDNKLIGWLIWRTVDDL